MPGMFRVCCLVSFLSIAACISYPEVTLVDGTHAASVSPDGSAERIALADDLELDARDGATDGGVLPHPEKDARAEAEPADDGSDDDDQGKGEGKPPKKKD